MVQAYEGNRAESTTMLPTITAFMTAHRLAEVTVVADAGMVSDANKRAIEAAGLSFTLGARIPDIPYAVTEWRREHPDEPMPDGLVPTQPWAAGPAYKRRNQAIYYRCKWIGRGARCAGSTSRSPRPSGRWPGRCRSNATGSSPSPAPTRA